MIRNLWSMWIMFFYGFFTKSSKLIIFVLFYYAIRFNHFFSTNQNSASFICICLYQINYNCILLSSFELNTIFLILSVKTTLCISLLTLCCVFNIDLVFYKFFMIFFNSIYINFIFFLDILFYSQVQLLLKSFFNF